MHTKGVKRMIDVNQTGAMLVAWNLGHGLVMCKLSSQATQDQIKVLFQ